MWTKGPVDREERKQLPIIVRVEDAGGLSSVQTILLVADDINDHPMKPGAKDVYLWKTAVSTFFINGLYSL